MLSVSVRMTKLQRNRLSVFRQFLCLFTLFQERKIGRRMPVVPVVNEEQTAHVKIGDVYCSSRHYYVTLIL